MDNLKDATTLIDELTSKLAELDRKVSIYRLGMAAEFTKYSEELLKHVPEDVAYQVSQAIEESLPNYPSLYPPASPQSSRSPTPTGLDEIVWHGNKSPPPILPHTSGQPKAPQNHDSSQPSQSIQRERDQELSGLFVPSYLPLLDSTDRPPHLPPTSPGAPSSTALPDTNAPGLNQSSNDRRERHRPSPLRRTTDTSVDSAASDSSSAKTRKSALRRSSSSSHKADSPRDSRRVRFDFEGKEVLPSSSPQTSSDTLTIADTTRSREKSALADDSYTNTQVSDIEGEQDDRNEKPKRVSSTQALRALSKEPLDEGTIWTVVNPGTGSEGLSEPDNVRYTPENTSPRSGSQVSSTTDKMASNNVQANTVGPTSIEAKKEVEAAKPTATVEVSEEEQSESDEEPALFMVSKRGFKTKPKGTSLQDDQRSEPCAPKLAPSPILPTRPAAFTSVTTSAPTPTTPDMLTDTKVPIQSVGRATGVVGAAVTGKVNANHKDGHDDPVAPGTADNDDEDELFEFDGDDQKSGNKSKKYLPESCEDEDEEHDDETVTQPAKRPQDSSDLPSSPPINVPARACPSPEHRIPKKVPPHPEGTRQPSTSIGSLGNRSLTPGPVKDQQLLEKVSKLDVEVPFFVGSVNGRSGPDASNVKSYQASLMSPTQTSSSFVSGSFAERLMWEKSQGVFYESDAEDNKNDKKNDKRNRR